MAPTATTSSQALQNLQSFQSGEQSPDQILSSQEQSLGVPQAQQQVSGLRQAIQNTTNLLNNVAPSVYGRTQNSLETNAQANANIANEQAPISTKLSQQNTDYSNQESDLQNLLSQSGTLAGLKAQGQSGQEALLQGIYQDLYGQESDSAKLAEQIRNDNLTASTAANSGALSPSLMSLSSGSSTSSPGMKLKGSSGSSGYAFTDTTGNPISANQYAQLTGQSLGTLLHTMGSSGDKYAQQAYNEISSNQAYYSAHPDILQKEFSLLF